MKKVLFIFQTIFKFSLIFLFCFIWTRFLKQPLWLTFVLATILTVIVILITHVLNKKNKLKQNLKQSEKEAAENMFLSLLSDKNHLKFFLELTKSRHPNAIIKNDYILITHQDNSKVILLPFINMQMLSLNDIAIYAKLCKSQKADKIIILCHDYEKQCIAFSKNFDIEMLILDRFDTYSMLYKEYEFYPEITMKYKKDAALTFKELLAYSFNKSRSKGYIFASIILFITSFFVKINIYYCICASILLIFAFISYINPKYNKIKSSELI